MITNQDKINITTALIKVCLNTANKSISDIRLAWKTVFDELRERDLIGEYCSSDHRGVLRLLAHHMASVIDNSVDIHTPNIPKITFTLTKLELELTLLGMTMP